MPDYVRTLDPELTHQQHAVPCVIGDTDRPLDRAAASKTRAVVAQEQVAIGKDGLRHERLGPGSANARRVR
jgi:hypothetical protein